MFSFLLPCQCFSMTSRWHHVACWHFYTPFLFHLHLVGMSWVRPWGGWGGSCLAIVVGLAPSQTALDPPLALSPPDGSLCSLQHMFSRPLSVGSEAPSEVLTSIIWTWGSTHTQANRCGGATKKVWSVMFVAIFNIEYWIVMQLRKLKLNSFS